MKPQPNLDPLLETSEALLAIAKQERDAYRETVELDDGTIPSAGDRTLLARLDALIDKAEAVLFAYRTEPAFVAALPKELAAIFREPTRFAITTHRPRRAPLWARLAKRLRSWRARREARMPRTWTGWRPQA